MDMDKILIVDDDQNICELLRLYIEKEGFSTVIANDGKQALEIFEEENPVLIMLDIMLPGLDGWQVCREIRKKSQVPIIMLTAKGEVFDKVLGLELGADDYVIKPFSLAILLAKTTALIRRSRGTSDGTLICGEIRLDTGRMACTVCNTAVKLSPREYDLLLCLLRNRGRVLSREQLLTRVWGWDFEGELRAVDVQIKNLRAALGPAGGQIKTVVKAGYKLEEA